MRQTHSASARTSRAARSHDRARPHARPPARTHERSHARTPPLGSAPPGRSRAVVVVRRRMMYQDEALNLTDSAAASVRCCVKPFGSATSLKLLSPLAFRTLILADAGSLDDAAASVGSPCSALSSAAQHLLSRPAQNHLQRFCRRRLAHRHAQNQTRRRKNCPRGARPRRAARVQSFYNVYYQGAPVHEHATS